MAGGWRGGRAGGRAGRAKGAGARVGAARRRVAEDLDLLAVLLDRDDVLARVDDVEPVARVALLDHRLPRRDGDALHHAGGRGGQIWEMREGCGA